MTAPIVAPHVHGYRNPFNLSSTTVLSFVIIVLNAQLFADTAANPMGIRGLQEGFYLILIIWSVLAIWTQQLNQGAVPKLDLLVLAMVVIPMLYGAVAANLVYGQPITFGLIEERRILAGLIYFPVATMLRRGWIDFERLQSMIAGSAAICALTAIGVAVDIIPALKETRTSEVFLRGEHIVVGANMIALAIPLLVARGKGHRSRLTLLLIGILVSALLFVVQSRQIMIGALIATVFVLRGARAMFVVSAAVAAFYLALLLVPAVRDTIELLFTLFAEITTNQYLTESWRGLAYNHVFQTFSAGEIWGHGALSPMWNEGFSREIGAYFFLADIGIAGSVFRYGLFGALLYAIYFIVQFRLIRQIPKKDYRTLLTGLVVLTIVTLPVAAPLEFRGFIAGLILAVSGHLVRESRT